MQMRILICSGLFNCSCARCEDDVEVEASFGKTVEAEDLDDELADALYIQLQWENGLCPECQEAVAKEEAADAQVRAAAIGDW